jgi:hypothetical protein
MTRIFRDKDGFHVQDKWMWMWVGRTAVAENGGELPCTLTGFDTLEDALENAQTSPVYIHENCFIEDKKHEKKIS